LGDCTEVMQFIQPDYPNLILTDIPFNVSLNYLDYEDKISEEEYISNLEKWFTAMSMFKCRKIIKIPTKFSYMILPVFNKILGYKWTVVQHSPNATSHGPFNLTLFTQYIVSVGEGKVPSRDFFVNTDNTLETRKFILHHPAEMPIEPMRVLIKWFSDANDVILDPFVGSGTTCVAAKLEERRFIGIDISKEYCDISCRRLKGIKLSDYPVPNGLGLIKIKKNLTNKE